MLSAHVLPAVLLEEADDLEGAAVSRLLGRQQSWARWLAYLLILLPAALVWLL